MMTTAKDYALSEMQLYRAFDRRLIDEAQEAVTEARRALTFARNLPEKYVVSLRENGHTVRSNITDCELSLWQAQRDHLDAINQEAANHLPDRVYDIWLAAVAFERRIIWPEFFQLHGDAVQFGRDGDKYSLAGGKLRKNGKAAE